VVHELLLAKHGAGEIPTNNRFMFYELEQRGLATKPNPDDQRKHRRRNVGWPPGQQDITDALMWLREEGLIPWRWITDQTRHIDVWLHAPSVLGYLRDRLDEARINPWGDEPPPLIICESKATADVLRSAVSEYVCPITGTGGQCGGFLRTEVAPLLIGNDRRPLYIGDLDKSGVVDIEGNTRRVLERASRRPLDWRRVAIRPEQAQNIEPILKPDGRERDRRLHRCWEVESLGQRRLVALVREALDELLPEPLFRVQAREAEQRQETARLLNGWSA
jgi:hypothetical protein